MPETEDGTSSELLHHVQSIPCTIDVTRLREVTRKNLDCLMVQYPRSDFPILYNDLQNLVQCLDLLDTTESARGRMLWMFNLYLCFFSSPVDPLFPKNKERLKILEHLRELNISAQ